MALTISLRPEGPTSPNGLKKYRFEQALHYFR